MKSKKNISPYAWIAFAGLFLGVLGSIDGYEWLSLFSLFSIFALFAIKWDERFRRNIALAARNAFVVAFVGNLVAGGLIYLDYPKETVYSAVIGMFPTMVLTFAVFLFSYERWGD